MNTKEMKGNGYLMIVDEESKSLIIRKIGRLNHEKTGDLLSMAIGEGVKENHEQVCEFYLTLVGIVGSIAIDDSKAYKTMKALLEMIKQSRNTNIQKQLGINFKSLSNGTDTQADTGRTE